MHQIEMRTYPCRTSTKKINKECTLHAKYEGDSHSGLYTPIRFIDKVLKNYDEACKYIEEHDGGWYDSLAIKYKEGRKIYWLVKYEFHC